MNDLFTHKHKYISESYHQSSKILGKLIQSKNHLDCQAYFWINVFLFSFEHSQSPINHYMYWSNANTNWVVSLRKSKISSIMSSLSSALSVMSSSRVYRTSRSSEYRLRFSWTTCPFKRNDPRRSFLFPTGDASAYNDDGLTRGFAIHSVTRCLT